MVQPKPTLAFVPGTSSIFKLSSNPSPSTAVCKTLPWRNNGSLTQPCVSRSSSFFGLRSRLKHIQPVRPSQKPQVVKGVTTMVVDPWSVSPEAVDALAAQFFAASLFPYLGFLYLLGRGEVDCPKLANFGFRFLLVFVFATIPAGIYSKVHYQDILANVDWLHGSAEAFLTITNLLIVLGFRNAMSPTVTKSESTSPSVQSKGKPLRLKSIVTPSTLVALGGVSALAALGVPHAEPWNALSFPTWVIHVSSLIEWLVAMGLVWKYADFSNNQRWKGLTWGMLPLHTSGICACTYHFFYNDPSLNILVALQAALTFFGNATMAFATYRILKSKGSVEPDGEGTVAAARSVGLVGFEDLGTRFESDSNLDFLYKVFALSAIGSAAVKWGSRYIDVPFEPSLALALSIIGVPTALNMTKWAVRSTTKSSDFGSFL